MAERDSGMSMAKSVFTSVSATATEEDVASGMGVGISGARLEFDRVARRVRAEGNDRAASSGVGRVNEVPQLVHVLGKAAALLLVALFPFPDPDPVPEPEELVLVLPLLVLFLEVGVGLVAFEVSSRDLVGRLRPPQHRHQAVWSSVPGLIRPARRIRALCRVAKGGEMGSRSGGRVRRWSTVVGVG